ncbi:hypothetical protein [Candidatus Nitrosotenuis sp. DW1]|uniref:hypothetical protein n=1 Tax=Candidatus Nitrosotenuis sp. DW1 TaxID=2259672 RepID=UPI0015C85C14|nr:hypothetical protein [Candidatus Nitrosotenuis sp. DW1]QLH08415.1 hypothetical protein DSQ19_01985 [Candidatus Nitrosotenuis sp. DW1]
MFGRKRGIKEGDYAFSSKQDGDYKNIIFGIVTGVDGSKIGISGLIVNPIGLKNKVSQGKAGPRSEEILKSPTPENCIFAFIYRTEHENFNDVIDLDSGRIIPISEKAYSVLDGWIRESLPELINNVLSLPDGAEKDEAKRTLKRRMETLYDKNLKQNLYSVCRSLKILV